MPFDQRKFKCRKCKKVLDVEEIDAVEENTCEVCANKGDDFEI